MTRIQPCPLPPDALLLSYAGKGGYVDCYSCEIEGRVSHVEFVQAFYTTALFKLERLILRWAVMRPSSNAQAAQLARAETSEFAAWSVEARAPDQILLRDLAGRTRSWLMVAPVGTAGERTRLLFGSGIVPVRDASSGAARLGWSFRALLGFHKLYSRALLGAARRRLSRVTASKPSPSRTG
jgi:hypothetical protein